MTGRLFRHTTYGMVRVVWMVFYNSRRRNRKWSPKRLGKDFLSVDTLWLNTSIMRSAPGASGTGIAVAGDGARGGNEGPFLSGVLTAAAEDTTRRRGVRRIVPSGIVPMLTSGRRKRSAPKTHQEHAFAVLPQHSGTPL